MGEFELIRQYFQPLAESTRHNQLILGPGDDCAIQRIEPGQDLVFSVDTLVEGVHFPRHYSPEHLGWRSLAVAASDLAAMGASPACFTLALTLPAVDSQWLEGFAAGLAKAASAFGLALAGGDTTRGPMALSIQVHGTVCRGKALCRSGARPGDLVCVSGTLGAAGAALDFLDTAAPDDLQQAILSRYHHPQPRLALGQALVCHASAAIDISDGLLADLGHILQASGVGARIEPASLPIMDELVALKGAEATDLALTAGDDYELCVTLAPGAFQQLLPGVRQQLTVIGLITKEPGIALTGRHLPTGAGFDHFRRSQ